MKEINNNNNLLNENNLSNNNKSNSKFYKDNGYINNNIRNDDLNKDVNFNMFSDSKIISMQRELKSPLDVINITELLKLSKSKSVKHEGN